MKMSTHVQRTGMLAALGLLAGACCLHAETAPPASPVPTAVDPLVKASAYGDKSVWSYHGKDPLPWSLFKPRDYGSAKIVFNAEGVRPVGTVPAPGVHPRIFFSPEDLPAIRQRIKEDRGAQEAWKNILSYTNAIKLTYDEKADYAQPDWANGDWHIHGRTVEIHRIGSYGKNREDYFGLLAAGKNPEKTFGKNPSGFYFPAAIEAFRCLIADDAQGGATLAKAVETAVRLEQERRTREDKPVQPGQPPKPSTPRYAACNLGLVYDFIYNWMTPEQKRLLHDELVLLSAWADNYGTFNNAEASRSNWATFTYWVWDLMAIEGEPGFNDLKFLGLYRGWRNFFTYSFFDSGAAYEAEGKLLFGLDAVVAFDRVAPKYGLELLAQHPLLRAHYAKFTALSVLPTQDKYAIFDILGRMGGGLCTPQDIVVAHYLYPNDATIDFVYRTTVGDDYRTLPMPGHSWNNLITCGIFATSHNPAVTPEKLNLPLTFFCGQRAMLMTRSSWDKNATMLTMHVRGASGGHPYRDRNGIMLAAQGRTWVTIPGKDTNGRLCNTVLVNGSDQSCTTPARAVDFVDRPMATFMVGDAKYCWDWIWSSASQTPDGKSLSRQDIENGNIQVGAGWKLVEQSFNDFAYTKVDTPAYNRPLKFTPGWIAPDGVYSATVRQPNLPVLKAFRTAGVVRGPHPYALVVDDIQRNCLPALYDWNLTLADDVVMVRTLPTSAQPGDLVFAGGKSLAADGTLKPGEPALLIRVLERKGEPLPPVFGKCDKMNLLTISARAASPDFKILLYPFSAGQLLPQTAWKSALIGRNRWLTLEFPDQRDRISFTPAASGKTDLCITRDGKEVVTVNRPVAKLADPDSDRITAQIEQLPTKLPALKTFNPDTLPGLVASWTLDEAKDGAFPASQPGIPGIPAATAKPVPGMIGGAALFTNTGVTVPLDLRKRAGGGVTFAFWVKSNTPPWMGSLFSANGFYGFDLSLTQGGLGFNTLRKWSAGGANSSSMLTGWTHFAATSDNRTVVLYRNGAPLLTFLASPKPPELGAAFSLGGGGYGGFEGAYDDVRIYDHALDAETVERLYLYGGCSGIPPGDTH